MPQTKMFRDRVVSMEQTLEGGERSLELLKAICREALPEFRYREHTLDHERDLFVLVLDAPDGRTKRVCWTRMVLFDAERIPALTGDPLATLRARIVDLLRSKAGRPEIVVTFRHLEEGWVDTPEPRRERKRRRGRGDRGRRERHPETLPAAGRPAQQPTQRVSQPPRESHPQPPSAPAAGPVSDELEKPRGGRRRRRFRRRRRGRGPVPPGSSGPARTQ